ncbi:MerR family transcriptional regulator [Pedobacter gandavensis]|uniref:MerR family transcriptional regulator n=1 Tax=Pedobacter gandavensis TaxID=2679963 RepID=A0ABR6EV73_9SPHI|nr:MerR family transcriptional regulator [Pedobacter gandavensis]MBB2149139.1 MerR family transcriptional regulator [Pedobacter gandavensis]
MDKYKYSISDLEQLSGIHVDTIRIWERRYNALTPMRSAGNTRLYNDQHLRRLLNIVGLSQSGMKISQVCALSDQQIDQLLKKEIDYTISSDSKIEYYISQLLKYGLAYNELKFDQLITSCIEELEMTSTYKNVLYPLLVRLGLMWRRDTICPAQEHFLSNIIRQKLFVAIDKIQVKNKTTASWLLFLPEDEDHDIGLLFAQYLLKSAGHRVIFLGGRVPMDSLKDAMAHNQSEHILLFMVRSRPVTDAQAYLNTLSENFSGSKIHLAGNSKLLTQLQLAENINWFQSIEGFEQTINQYQNVN